MNTPPTHPLVRQGTHQRERLLQSLIPANLKLDDRSMADLLAFVGQLATHVRYWPDTNTLSQPESNWEGFWQSDATPLLAVLSATDLTDLRSRYRTTELAYLRAEEDTATGTISADRAKPDAPKPDDLLTTLVEQLFEAARQTAELYTKLPVSHPLKAEFGRLIGEKLHGPIRQVIAYHKGVSTVDLLKKYQQASFIDTDMDRQPWGLTGTHDFRNGIKLQRPNNTDREPLWRLFLSFYNVLSAMVAKTGKSFQYALQSRSDHPPHVTLLLSFLYLFRHLQADFNVLPEKHLLFYYGDVLRLQQRGAIPDRVHVVFEMAQNVERYRLLAGTLFRGGVDRLGRERLYALETETVISKAKLVEQKSLYFLRNSSSIPIVQARNATGLSAKAEYLKLAGKIQRLEKAAIGNVQPLTGAGAISTVGFVDSPPPTQLSSEAQAQKARWEGQRTTYIARPGLLICSPELWMDQSEGRAISIVFSGSDFSSLSDQDKPEKNAKLNVQFSTGTEKSTSEIKDIFQETRLFSTTAPVNGTATAQIDLNDQLAIFLKENSGNFNAPVFQHKDGELRIFLPPSFPALKPYTGKDEPLLVALSHPFILIQPEDPADYEAFSKVSFNSVTLQTASRRLKNLTLQLGDVVYPANGDIPLVGATANPVSTFLYVGTPEISMKTISFTETSLDLSKTGLPPAVIGNHSVLINGQWNPPLEKPDDVAGEIRAVELAVTSVPNTKPFDQTPLTYKTNSNRTFLAVQLTIDPPADGKPINTYKISPESIALSYKSNPTDSNPIHQLYHYHPFGGLSKLRPGPMTLAPKYPIPKLDGLLLTNTPITSVGVTNREAAPAGSSTASDKEKMADGNLFLGFENLVPGQTLSVLFRMEEGTDDPDKTPPPIVWSYYRNNEPVKLPPAYILSDETDGLSRTGVIRFQIPGDITMGIKTLPGEKGRLDLFWLRASATEYPSNDMVVEALPFITQIHAQAATLVFDDHKNTLEHLTNGLPPQTISQLRVRDVNVRKVVQPEKSVGGRLPEGTDVMAYYRRISERLRHKQRAITVWDYERLVLEQFPKIDVVKCLPHTERDDLIAPGYVTVAVIPNPDMLTGRGRFYPAVGAGDRKAITNYLNQHNSFFVSGVGGFKACCCHDEEDDNPTQSNDQAMGNAGNEAEADHSCGCEPQSRLQVLNAHYEPVRLRVCVRFYSGKDIVLYTKILNDALREFLSPWTRVGSPPVTFGLTIKTTQLLRFLENLDYVDVVMSIRVKHLESKDGMLLEEPTMPWSEADELQPFTPRSVLTTYLNELDEENDNVLDHEINVIETDNPCGCSTCKEDAVPVQSIEP